MAEGRRQESTYCQVCSKKFSNHASYENHINSKKHKQNEKKAQNIEEDNQNLFAKKKKIPTITAESDLTRCLFSNKKASSIDE